MTQQEERKKMEARKTYIQELIKDWDFEEIYYGDHGDEFETEEFIFAWHERELKNKLETIKRRVEEEIDKSSDRISVYIGGRDYNINIMHTAIAHMILNQIIDEELNG